MDRRVIQILEDDEDANRTAASGAAVDAFADASNGDICGPTSGGSNLDQVSITNATTMQPYVPVQSSASTANNLQSVSSPQSSTSNTSNVQTSARISTPSSQVAEGVRGENGTGSAIQQPVSQWQHFRPQQQEILPERRQQHQQRLTQHQVDVGQSASSAERSSGSSQAISFGTLMPMLLPTLQAEEGEKLLALYQKLRRSEISKEDFLRTTRVLVGDQVLVQTVKQMQAKQQLLRQAAQAEVQQQQTLAPHTLPQQPQSKQMVEQHQQQNQPFQAQDSSSSDMAKPNRQEMVQSLSHQPPQQQLQSTVESTKQYQTNSMQSRVPHMSSFQILHEPWHERQVQSASGAINLQQVKNEVDKTMSSMHLAGQQPQSSQHHLSQAQFSASQVGNSAGGHNDIVAANLNSNLTIQTSSSPLLTSSSSFVPASVSVPGNTSQPQAMSGAAQVRTPPKKSLSDQRRLTEASPLLQARSKKQKVAGDVLDQSIDQLNDVTAVSGVNLREEEEQLLAGPKEESRTTQAMRRFAQEEEGRLFLEKGPLRTKVNAIAAKYGVNIVGEEVDQCLSMSTEERLRSMLYKLIKLSGQRADEEKERHKFSVTSDIQRDISSIRKMAKEAEEKRRSIESERIRKLNEEKEKASNNEGAKEEVRTKEKKAQKDEEVKQRANAANMAARAAAGVNDFLIKWQMMAEQGRQKREGDSGTSDVATDSNVRMNHGSFGGREGDKKHHVIGDGKAADRTNIEGPTSGATFKKVSGSATNRGPAQRICVPTQPVKSPRTITVRDVIAFLETEPQMAKSTLLYRLYDKSSSLQALTTGEAA